MSMCASSRGARLLTRIRADTIAYKALVIFVKSRPEFVAPRFWIVVRHIDHQVVMVCTPEALRQPESVALGMANILRKLRFAIPFRAAWLR